MSSNIRVQKICEYCSQEFEARTTVTKYCSDTCSKRAYKERIREEKIEKSNNETEVKQKGIDIDELKALAEKEFLTMSEVSTLLSVHRTTIWRMIKEGKLNAAKIGSRVIIKRTDIDKLFEK